MDCFVAIAPRNDGGASVLTSPWKGEVGLRGRAQGGWGSCLHETRSHERLRQGPPPIPTPCRGKESSRAHQRLKSWRSTSFIAWLSCVSPLSLGGAGGADWGCGSGCCGCAGG